MKKKESNNSGGAFRLVRKRGFLLVLVAGILLETIAVIQYVYTKRGLLEEANARAQSEMEVTQLKIDNFFGKLENNIQGVSYVLSSRFDTPEAFVPILKLLMEKNPEIVNSFVAFTPDYYRSKGRWYEPVVSRFTEGLVLHQVGGPDHDYFATEWYQVPFNTGASYWSEPYFDKDGVQKLVITYSIPVVDKSGTRVGVLGVDIELGWLQDVMNMVIPYANAHSTLMSRDGQMLVCPADTVADGLGTRPGDGRDIAAAFPSSFRKNPSSAKSTRLVNWYYSFRSSASSCW